jgi:hypothetical protein
MARSLHVRYPGIRLTKLTFGNIIKSGFEDSKTRPIALISFALNYYYHQYDPAGYHIVNIIIHFLSFFMNGIFFKISAKTGLNVV